MIKRVKEYWKGKNPYLVASVAIVIATVVVISLILQEEISTDQEADGVSTETVQSIVEEENGMAPSQEQKSVVESGSLDDHTASNEEKEPEKEPILEKESDISSVPESTPDPEVLPTPESVSESENIRKPEEKPEVDRVPEESTETDSEPEEFVEPEHVPVEEPDIPVTEPVVTPVPEVHEHSWSFESYYQEPTCSNGGLVNQICAHCGETQTTAGAPTGNHRYEVETPGDCCSVEVVICTDCNHREVREKDLSNHIDVEDGFCYGCGQKTE